MSDKIQPQHLRRKAVLYVRQSSAYQVTHNLESQRLQYGMEQRLRSARVAGDRGHRRGPRPLRRRRHASGRASSGWSPTSASARSGRSRPARCRGSPATAASGSSSSRYAASWTPCWSTRTRSTRRGQSNDRLLLGLKGSLNEYELDLLRQRSVEARHEKARRGELVVAAPVGLPQDRRPAVEKDPDRRVREAILLVFRKFEELGAVRQTLLWFLEEGLQLPARRSDGETGGSGRPTRRSTGSSRIRRTAAPTPTARRSPRRATRGARPRKVYRRGPQERWLALIPHAHEGYITGSGSSRSSARSRANVPGRRPRGGQARRGAAGGATAVPSLRPEADGAVHG